MTTPVELSKKELNKVFWRSYQALGCYTYDKQQGISYMRALLPALQKLYPDPEDLKEVLSDTLEKATPEEDYLTSSIYRYSRRSGEFSVELK